MRLDCAFDRRLTLERRARIVLNGIVDANQLRADRASWAHARNRRTEHDWQTKVDRLFRRDLYAAARQAGKIWLDDARTMREKFIAADMALAMPRVNA